MTITELGTLFILLESTFGQLTIHPDGTNLIFKDKTGYAIARIALGYGVVGEVWLRIDKVPPGKKEQLEKLLPQGRFNNIVTE